MDLLTLFSYVLIVIVLLPTVPIVAGRVIAIFTSFTATRCETLKPEGTPKGKALIVYEPGATPLTKKAAYSMGEALFKQGYEVDVAGIRSPFARNTTGYGVVLIGSPTYLGRVTGPVKKYLKNFHSDNGQIIGLFPTGTRGLTDEGAMPLRIIESMEGPLKENAIDVHAITYIGYKPFDYDRFVSGLVS